MNRFCNYSPQPSCFHSFPRLAIASLQMRGWEITNNFASHLRLISSPASSCPIYHHLPNPIPTPISELQPRPNILIIKLALTSIFTSIPVRLISNSNNPFPPFHPPLSSTDFSKSTCPNSPVLLSLYHTRNYRLHGREKVNIPCNASSSASPSSMSSFQLKT
jgi:hypothetical protein